MSATFSSNGYSDLRTYVTSNWNYIAILDQGGTELFRASSAETTNMTVSWVDTDASNTDSNINTVTIQGVITGSSPAVTLGTTQVGGAKLYKVSSGGTSLVDVTYSTPFAFQNTQDQLTVKITITLPGA